MIVIKQRVVYLFFLIAFIIPTNLITLGPLSFLYTIDQYIKYLAMAVILFDSLKHIKILFKEYKFSLLSGLFGASFLVYFIYTPNVWNFTHLKFYLSIVEQYYCVAFLVEYFLKKQTTFFVRYMYCYYFILTWLNFLCMLIKPNGFYMIGENPRYLIALDNGLILYMIPTVLLAVIYKYMFPKGLNSRELLTIVIVILSCIISRSATAIISIIVFVALLIFRPYFKPIMYRIMNIGYISLFYIVVVYLVLFKNVIGIFSDFIVNVLHRDPTMSSRTNLWQMGIEVLYNAPFYGMGYPRNSSEYLIEVYGNKFTSHNNILEIAMRGGVISVIAVVVLIVFVFIHTKKYEKDYITYFTSASYAALLIYYFSEVSLATAGWTFILGIIANCNYLSMCVKEHKQQCETNLKRRRCNHN